MTAENASKDMSLSSRVIDGALLSGATQVLFRLLGVASLSATARLLSPDDFGVVASASLVLALLDRLTSTGLSEYLVSRDTLNIEQVRTAWTVQCARQMLIAVVMVLGGDAVGRAMGDPRVSDVVRLLALVPLFSAVASPAFAMLQKDMRFARLMALRLMARVLAVVVVVGLAYSWRSYWALAWGNVAAALILTVLSYFAYPFLPRLRAGGAREVIVFSLQAMGRQLSRFAIVSAPKWVTRAGESSATFGGVSASMDLSALIAGEVVGALSQPALPSTAQLKDQAERLVRALNIGLGALFYLAIGAAAGFALVAQQAVAVLMGEQWAHIVTYVQILAPGMAAMAVGDVLANIMIALGHQRRVAYLWAVSAAVFAVLSYMAYQMAGMAHMLAVFSGLCVIFIAAMMFMLSKVLPARLALWGMVWRAFLATAVMSGVLAALPTFSDLPVLAVLALRVSIGAAAYVMSAALLWRVVGCPSGVEKFVWSNITSRLRR